ncbi:MAG: dTDP-4-dehydrorhamnose 3,5-epimerase [Planctomycetes bacterium]|nr:dTDP-4-dehydrorhamnose 3,5-epimerase [Planctomycetota bacterium]
MEIRRLEIPDVLLLTPRVFRDDRGLFYESFNQRAFEEAIGRPVAFVQDNHSMSARGVLRGLHYQLPPRAQGKLVRVVRGAAMDVAVDIRRGSPTFGRWVSTELSEENRAQMWIPAGFAHGFLALRDGTEVLYKTTDFYAPAMERGLAWNDARIGIRWDLREQPRLAARDAALPGLDGAELPADGDPA